MAELEAFFEDLRDEGVGYDEFEAPEDYVAARDTETGATRVLAGSTALSKHDLDTLAIWTSQLRRCVWCNTNYHEIDNIGLWRCRQHVCPLDTSSGIWTCCQRPQRREGCVSAHHRWMPGPYRREEAPLAISISLARRLGPRLDASTLVRPVSEGIVIDEHLVVQRYDEQATIAIYEMRRPLEDVYLAHDVARRAFLRAPRAFTNVW